FTFFDLSVRHQVEALLTTAGNWEVVPLPITPSEFEWLGTELDLHDLSVSPSAAGRIVDAQFHGCTQPGATLRANLVWAVYCRRQPSGVIQGATVDGRTGAFHAGVPQPPQAPP